MITKGHIHRAMAMASLIHPETAFTYLERQLLGSLLVYKSRGEFDGTFESAIECLKQAEYEIEE